jgi:hypothetical protein
VAAGAAALVATVTVVVAVPVLVPVLVLVAVLVAARVFRLDPRGPSTLGLFRGRGTREPRFQGGLYR